MAFDPIERSNYDGIPTTLYEFALGSTTWRYADAPADIPLGGNTYLATAVSHQGFSQSGDPGTDELNIAISADAEITQLFIGTPPSDPITAVVRSLHRGDNQAPVVWSGSIKSGRQISDAEWSFVCNSLLSTLNRNGLRLSWQRGCPHALYDRNCRVDPILHAVSLAIGGINGNAITSPAFGTLGSGHLAGGFLSFVAPHGNIERRAIESHDGNTIHLMGTGEGLSIGDWITVYPGCARTTAACEIKFNNLANYGGFPHLPTKSPFDGDPVF